MVTRIQSRRDSTTNWSGTDPVLASGEVAYDETTKTLRVGDGVTAWSSLVQYAKVTTISAGTGLTGGGTTAADRSLAVTYGSGSGTACQGNDSRLSDPRTPTGSAGGYLSGTYPNPGFAAARIDGVAGTASLRTLGTGATQAAAGNHAHSSGAASNITLSGGATAGSVTPAAQRISGSRVGLTGVVSSVSVGAGVTIGTIPATFRPLTQERQLVWGNGSRIVLVDIATSGVITATYLAGTAGAASSFVLDGVTYEAA